MDNNNPVEENSGNSEGRESNQSMPSLTSSDSQAGGSKETPMKQENTVKKESDQNDPIEEPAASTNTEDGARATDRPQADEKKSDDAVKQETENAQESSKQEQHYSTRGRNLSKESEVQETEREKREFEAEEPPVKEPKESSAPTTSFLDALGEDEKRIRTRFLPSVSGMHSLHKTEVKQDLALSRSIMSSSGLSSLSRRTRGKRGSGSTRDDDAMDVDEEEGVGQSEDERASEYSSVRLENITIPSRAFVAPPDTSATENGDGGGGDVFRRKLNHSSKSPHMVESITTFNPPRPPESVGPKKKHRMLRWENRPQDVDIDLINYKKTVQKAREEQRNARNERERIEGAASLLRTHFLSHLQALNMEGSKLNEELSTILQDCVAAADLLTSRTRSRGVGKGSYVMKEVLAVLKLREVNGEDKAPATPVVPSNGHASGFGGVNFQSFQDWDRSTVFEPCDLANSWILPGDEVDTPLGRATVVELLPSQLVEEGKPPTTVSVGPSTQAASKSAQTPVHGFGSATSSPTKAPLTNGNNSAKTNGVSKVSEVKSTAELSTTSPRPSTKDNVKHVLPPRVCVKLSFGKGFFPLNVIKPLVDTASLSFSELAARWKTMTESALSVSHCVDTAAMNALPFERKNKDGNDNATDEVMGEQTGDAIMEDANAPAEKSKSAMKPDRFIPFGSSMIPTASGRGTLLMTPPSQLLEKEMHDVVFSGGGVLGKVSLPCFRDLVKSLVLITPLLVRTEK